MTATRERKPVTCAECQDLKRQCITIDSEVRSLAARTRSRHPSPPERRRLVRLKTDAHIAAQLLQNHQATCEEAQA